MSKWEMVRLGDSATFINGFAFKPKDWTNEGLPIIRIQNLTGSSEIVNYYKGYYDTRYEINNEDILISWSASLGVYEWKQGKALLNQHIFKVVFDKLDYDKRFFIYVIEQKLRKMSSVTHGSTMKHIIKKHFDAIIIPYPPFDVQQKIADVLDKASALIELRKKQLEKIDLLIKSQFIEMFGDPVTNTKNWSINPLSKVCDVRDGTHDSPKYVQTGYPLLTSKNFTNGYIDFDDANFITETDFDSINQRSKVDRGDIVMPMIGTIGSPVIVNTDEPFAIKNVALIKFNNSCIVNVYLKTLLSTYFLEHSLLKDNRGGTQKFIALGDIRRLNIPLPPTSVQNEFLAFVKQAEKQKTQIQQSLKKLELNYKSLMQKCFRGDLF